ncbi:transcription factor NAI1-like [Andrographis paniculata]|uniref:transcription factor NAI1-like n=1 Tax=Andrographis paniculata TaxID=175694 RepID=UPI0021E8492F|nr:transcription factor NAI1-like [Andrographis paniculata]
MKSGTGEEGEGSSDTKSEPLPVIQARVAAGKIHIYVHCRRQNGAMTKLIEKVESLDMVVLSTNFISLGDSAVDITIVAEAEKEKRLKMTVKEIETALRRCLNE